MPSFTRLIRTSAFFALLFCVQTVETIEAQTFKGAYKPFNGVYTGSRLERIAFPIGGMGAGMFCLEGSGAISHMSVRNSPDVFNEPVMFGTIVVKGQPNTARVLEGPVPGWKKFGMPGSGKGNPGADWGLARCRSASFLASFPFAEIELKDSAVPVQVSVTGWSPFIPTDADNSSLPVGALEYTFKNNGSKTLDYVFSYNAVNFMTVVDQYGQGDGHDRIKPIKNGFILSQDGTAAAPENKGDFAIFADSGSDSTIVDHRWFRGGWYDPLTIAWSHIQAGSTQAVPAADESATGASLFVPFTLRPGREKKIRVLMAWYVPDTHLRIGSWPTPEAGEETLPGANTKPSMFHKPWYSHRFPSIDSIAEYWRQNYEILKQNTTLFKNAFYSSSLPPEVLEAVAANLTILKSPTSLRQYDGRFWGWEGCGDARGSCPGSCTHVWNYAQAICHLFPSLERTMRNTEFDENMNEEGQQSFRAAIPIRQVGHPFYAAADGQLGGVMKVYREWRISGDSAWLRKIYPKVKTSLNYCIRTWDPRHIGAVEEPHHNTYDIEFWGADPMCTGIYLGALEAMVKMGTYFGDDVTPYRELLTKGRVFMEQQLFNGKYFYQQIKWTGMSAGTPEDLAKKSFAGAYSKDGLQILEKEGPRYQYGTGCLSDGVIGAWIASVCGLESPFDTSKISAHLRAVYANNFKKDLSEHSNPQRSTYALGNEGGLLLCSWPNGGKPSLPFVYSNEVWTGIEYQVASHLISTGRVKEGLDIVRAARLRYDGAIRNPFDEYECGHWYARAMSSYALLESLTGVHYDAVDRTLYVRSRIGDFTSFLSTATGFGNVVFKGGKASLKTVYGSIPVEKIVVSR